MFFCYSLNYHIWLRFLLKSFFKVIKVVSRHPIGPEVRCKILFFLDSGRRSKSSHISSVATRHIILVARFKSLSQSLLYKFRSPYRERWQLMALLEPLFWQSVSLQTTDWHIYWKAGLPQIQRTSRISK